MGSILNSLHRQADERPDVIAIQGSNHSLSWLELKQAVESAAGELRQCRTLGLYMDNSPAWAIVDLAAIQAGLCHVPLPTFFSDEQLCHAINDAGIDTIITDDPARFESLAMINNRDDIAIAGTKLARLAVQQEQPASSHPGIAKITYTSGTTGSPRGVMLPLEHIETVADSLCRASDAIESDVALILLPLSTLLENIGAIYVPVLAGAQMVIPDPDETGLAGSSKINIDTFAFMLRQYQPSTLIVPPQMLKLLVGMAERKLIPDSFRYIAVGGAPSSGHLLAHASQLGLPVYQGYGLSEACSVISVNTPGQQRLGSVGKPLPHCMIRIADDGEIMVQGTLFRGYLNHEAVNGHQPGNGGELATGDIGHLDADGYLYITGRRKDIIISSFGRNIAPEWVESELQAHPAIAQAVVFGNDDDHLSAVIVPAGIALTNKPDPKLDQAVNEINLRLPDYARVHDVVLATSPFTHEQGELTANGRPRRDVIESKYIQLEEIQREERHGNVL